MPLYEYICENCEHILQVSLAVEEICKTVYCPNCGEKMIANFEYEEIFVQDEMTKEDL
jgi:putative FmdB family regulatory protein